jgi:hypothetical protein
MKHEAGEEFVGVDDGQLSAILCGLHVHAFGLEAWAKGIPVLGGRHQNNPFAVRQRCACEATDSAIEKALILVELYT